MVKSKAWYLKFIKTRLQICELTRENKAKITSWLEMQNDQAEGKQSIASRLAIYVEIFELTRVEKSTTRKYAKYFELTLELR